MRNYYLLLLFFSASFTILSAQTIAPFSVIEEAAISLPQESEVNLPLSSFQSLDVDVDALRNALADTPQESAQSLRHSTHIISVPLPNGGETKFRVVESSVMHAELQARWPQLRSYRAINVDQPQFQGRFSVTTAGLHGAFQTTEGSIYIEPYASHQSRFHVVYDEEAIYDSFENNLLTRPSCGFDAAADEEHSHDIRGEEQSGGRDLLGDDMVIREYDLALTCTGEYAQQKGGTLESVLASFVSATTLVNQIFEQEIGIRVKLLANQEPIIFLNPFTDPFINADNGGELLSQVQFAIVNIGGIPGTVFDMGHVFTSSCTDVGGVVAGGSRVCGGNKTSAVTCHYSNSIAAIVNNVMSHEVAHHFSVGHSWNNCPSSAGQLASDSAWEPGSGSTIMSYSGSCGADNNLFNDGGPYYHAGSIDQFIRFTRVTGAASCATIVETDNTEPDINWPYEDGFYIPISTPFELDASADDAENDPMTYVWDQMNLGPNSTLGSPSGNAPSFRSYSPKSATKRVFPRLPILVNNASEVTEVLPAYSRDLDFRFLVRDNNPEVSASVWEDVSFHATATAGPFRVISPNSGSESWKGGELREVVWDVANTDNELVNCKLVNIKLSTDGGFTYPITLISEVFNNGSAQVYIPDGISTNEARIRIEAAHNVFFDISNEDFEVRPAEIASFTMNYTPFFQNLCLPGSTSVGIESAAILDFADDIELSLIGNIHPDLMYNFDDNVLTAGESTALNFDFSNVENYDGPMEVTLQVVSENTDTAYQNFHFELVDNNFDELALLLPVDGQSGVELITDFSWTSLPNAQLYDWEVATDASFTNILDSKSNSTSTELTPNVFFEENTLFFWRVRPINECGTGDWSETKVFHTINSICSQETPGDVPINIPGTGTLPTVTSDIYVPFDGQISDVNIPYLNVGYQPIQNFYISLISPSGTEVRLYDQTCFTTDLVSLGFDDEAPSDIVCPPDDGVVFRPVEPLSAFIGENSLGIWTLKVKVLETGFGAPGQLNNWGVEFCAAGNAQAPTMITNDTLFVPPGAGNYITNDKLEVMDSEQGAEDIQFTITSLPEYGTLYLAENEMAVGDYFRQISVNVNNVVYQHDGSNTQYDDFTFVVEDGTGGFLPTQQFNIKIDENAVVGTDDIFENLDFQLYPNPTSDWVRLALPLVLDQTLPVQIFNTQGQLLHSANLQAGSSELFFDMNRFPSGVYIIQVGQNAKRLMKM